MPIRSVKLRGMNCALWQSNPGRTFFVVLMVWMFALAARGAEFDWKESTPQAQGMSDEKVEAMRRGW